MNVGWARLTSAAHEGRLVDGVRRRLRELYLEQHYRAALGVRYLQAPWLTLPCISMNGDFAQSLESGLVRRAFDDAISNVGGPAQYVRNIDGMSGQKYRTFINALVKHHPNARYLEVGSWAGSTAASAIHGNSLEALCIDNWSEFGGPKTSFFKNIDKVSSPSVDFRFIESDFRRLDYASLGSFNIYLFDGPHGEQDHYDGIMVVRPALDERVIIIVDDWNWRQVRLGTFRALRDAQYRVEASIEIRTARGHSHPTVQGKHSDWHNGYFISVCAAPPIAQ
jgi:hypothetical protein